MNQQGLFWNVHYVATIVVRKQINFQSAVKRFKRSYGYRLKVTWHDSNNGQT